MADEYGTYALVWLTAPSVHGSPCAFCLLKSTLSADETGWVGQVFTSGALLCGTFTSVTGISGLPVSRSRTNVIPYLLTNATAGLTTVWNLVTFFVLPFTLTVAVNGTL